MFELHLHVPQIIFLGLQVLGIGIAIAIHGKPRTGYENAWMTLVASLLSIAIVAFGGFFSH